MRKITVILTVLVIIFVTVSIAAQQGRGRGAGRQQGFNIDKLTRVLDLTDEQAKQIQQMHYENQKAAIELKSSLERNKLELKNMVASNNIVDSEILNVTSNSSDLTGELKMNKIQLWLDVYKILNPEQQEKWTKHFQRMGERSRARGVARGERMRQERRREHVPELEQ